tara:strand:- start:954 stop:1652 length:699 start_codon:yes stop_codon:yes gene_type:complete
MDTKIMNSVKLSKTTLELLKNFASINSNILVKPGKMIQTISPVKNVLAQATVQETFDVEFGIWDLNKFLGTISLFSDPVFSFGEKSVEISSEKGNSSVTYYYSEPKLLTVPTKSLNMPDAVVSFDLTSSMFQELMKAASVMQLNDLCARSNNGQIELVVMDRSEPTSNNYSVVVGELQDDHDFEFYFKVENLKLLPGDYHVEVSDGVVSQFSHSNLDATYWIALESDSKFNS